MLPPLAFAGGGGIDNWGVLTLKRTRVSDNEVSGAVSDAEGAGILNEHSATLTLDEVVVARNRAVAGVPYGRFASGGGIFAAGDGGAVAIRNSSVVGNTATLDTELVSTPSAPVSMDPRGGAHIGDGVPTTVDNTAILDNKAAHGPSTPSIRLGNAGGIARSRCTTRSAETASLQRPRPRRPRR